MVPITRLSLQCLRARLAMAQLIHPINRHFSGGVIDDDLSTILQQVSDGKLSPMLAANMIQTSTQVLQQSTFSSPEQTLQSFANLDHSRASRTGFPEAVFGEGKTAYQIACILDDMARHANELAMNGRPTSSPILATRVQPELYHEIAKLPVQHGQLKYHETARIVAMTPSTLEGSNETTNNNNSNVPSKRVVVATAGTTDLPVAEEAAVTLEAAHCQVDRIYDVGVAGLHRIIRNLPKLQHPSVSCIIVCAGMDGALPSVVGGLVSCPVLAVPTSIGYGVSLGGISAMLTMLNSCAPGVAVQNIDNGFGAAAFAYKCIRRQ
ncbi:phosphoribosylaminoimidazole carboxylase [Nitzschia inconspicua]|uniref:phosphoribosylaminoimidazole carboxylase n=1 Tax=Nitzschia inconspicua TaxID=303405 RepID=A0A9K3Q6Y1_9STRA|nr:phosphoribosylaminoimidazole carboxylase [Nitzschia inconspicua]